MRKSEKLGLSEAYDWSNPNIRDEVLILRVLERHRFEDVMRVCLHYGVDAVAHTEELIKDVYIKKILDRMLQNIKKGIFNARNQADTP